MVRITDPDALDKLTLVEGAEWRKYQEDNPARPFGFYAFLAEYRLWEQEGMTEEYIENLKPDRGDGCLYGNGGYNRYTVGNTGEIVFLSSMASRPIKIEEARAAGFTIR